MTSRAQLHFAHFTDEEREAKWDHLSKTTTRGSGRMGTVSLLLTVPCVTGSYFQPQSQPDELGGCGDTHL